MSAERLGAGERRLSRTISALVFIVLAGLLIFGGVRLWRFQALDDRVMASLSGEYLKASSLQPMVALKAEVGDWTATPGVAGRARELYLRLAQAMAEPASNVQVAAANVLAIDPANSAVWLDLATASWLSRQPDTALAAWNMSYVTGPREFDLVHWRVAFLVSLWPELPNSAKEMMFSQLQVIFGEANRSFGPYWRRLLARLTPDVRAQIEREWRAYQGITTP